MRFIVNPFSAKISLSPSHHKTCVEFFQERRLGTAFKTRRSTYRLRLYDSDFNALMVALWWLFECSLNALITLWPRMMKMRALDKLEPNERTDIVTPWALVGAKKQKINKNCTPGVCSIFLMILTIMEGKLEPVHNAIVWQSSSWFKWCFP